MSEQPNLVESVSPQARLQAELLRLESQHRELWVIVAFAAAVLALGALSLLIPTSFWHFNVLEMRIPPQVIFLLMMAFLVVVLYIVRREMDVQKLRLANLQQSLAAKSEQAASMIDAVTNVFSRAFLHDLLHGEIARTERNGRPLSLLMCDLNDFKQVNDRYGHLMGDYVLSQIATILKSCVRGSDYVVRYGGDEFLLLLPETEDKGAEVVRRRIRQKVNEWDQTNRVGELPISISMGLYLHVPGQSAEQDVAEADARMYQDKQGIRPKVEVPRPTAAKP